jgi:hypothetical protein
MFNVFNEMATAQDIFFTTEGYNWNILDSDYEDDWALIKIAIPFPSTAGDMDVYGGADSSFEAIGSKVHLNAFPASVLGSNGNCQSGGNQMFIQSNALVTSTANQRTKWKADAGGRSSGGGYFFCPQGPDETCEVGDVGEIVAVHAGWNIAESRHIGPKGASFHAAANTIMNSNN